MVAPRGMTLAEQLIAVTVGTPCLVADGVDGQESLRLRSGQALRLHFAIGLDDDKVPLKMTELRAVSLNAIKSGLYSTTGKLR
jgi:hypothetical protein